MTSPPPRGHTPPRPRRSTSKTTRTPPRRTPSLRSQPWERYGSSALARGDSDGPTNSKPWSTQEYRNPSTQVDRHMKPAAPSVQEHRNTCAQAHRNMESPAYVFSGPWGQGNISTQVPKNRRIPTLVNTSASGHSHTGLREDGNIGAREHGRTGTRAQGNSDAPDHGSTGSGAHGNTSTREQ